LFFDSDGGPSLAPGAGHVAIGVDFKGGVYRRDASWANIGILATFPDDETARSTADIVIVLPNNKLPDGQFSDDVINKFLTSNKTKLTYPYCSTYSAEAMKKGGYDLGNGNTPGYLLAAAKKIPGVELRDYKARDYVVSAIGMPTPTIAVNIPSLFIHQKTVPYSKR
jgi:hypothetical protein